MNHGRKYGANESRPIPLWNGVFEHYDRISDALWEFLWCIDAITREKDGIGLVIGGAPVKLKRIVADLKADKETVRRHLKNLADEHYIRVRRTPYGQIIEVLNSKKFGIWRKEKPQNAVSQPIEKPIYEHEKPIHEPEKPQNAVSKEDAAVTQQKDAAASRAAVWSFLGVDGSRFKAPVREICAKLYGVKNGETPVEFVGACMDRIVALGEKIPAPLAQRAEQLRQARKTGAEVPELEAPAWAK